MNDRYLMYNMDAFSYSDRIKNGNKICILPVGAIEQHGPHMAVSVDIELSRSVSLGVAEKLDCVVAHPVTYAAKSQQRSGGGYHLTGTISLDGNTMMLYTKDIIKELAKHGFKNIILMNGHFENSSFLMEAADLALRDIEAVGRKDVRVIFLSYWDFVSEEVIKKIYPEGFFGWDIEHGGVMETSLMLYLHPSLVDMSRLIDIPPAQMPPYDVFPIIPERTPASGCLSSAKNATKEKGKILYEACIESIYADMKNECFGLDEKQEMSNE